MTVGSHGLTEKQRIAVDVIATNINATIQYVAKIAGCSTKSVSSWKKNPNFIEAIYDRYVELTGVKLIEVLEALFEKALDGDVSATRLLLEHHQKLQRNVNITIDSPFEKFMKINNIPAGEIAEGEVVEPIPIPVEVPKEALVVETIPQERVRHAKLDERARYNADQLKRRRLRIRAEAVGLKLFPKGKHPQHKRDVWLKKLKKLEAEQGIIYPDDEI